MKIMINKYFLFLCNFISSTYLSKYYPDSTNDEYFVPKMKEEIYNLWKKYTEEYTVLLNILFNITFYPIIPNDDNRVADGLQLREKFMETHEDVFLFPNNCSFLEMLIGLALRLEFETEFSKWEKSVSEWFWILIDNLGLKKYTNSYLYLSPIQMKEAEEEIFTIIQKVNNREYERDGNGGLFPLKNPKKDQRRIEIWYQMNAYVMENYPI